jgi:hypothetical protein
MRIVGYNQWLNVFLFHQENSFMAFRSDSIGRSRLALLYMIVVAGLLLLTSSVTVAQETPAATPVDEEPRFDVYPHPQTRGALAFTLGDRWDHTNLTYYFDNCPSTIDCQTAERVIRDA